MDGTLSPDDARAWVTGWQGRRERVVVAPSRAATARASDVEAGITHARTRLRSATDRELHEAFVNRSAGIDCIGREYAAMLNTALDGDSVSFGLPGAHGVSQALETAYYAIMSEADSRDAFIAAEILDERLMPMYGELKYGDVARPV